MNGHDFIPLIVQLKDLLFLSGCFAADEGEEAALVIAELGWHQRTAGSRRCQRAGSFAAVVCASRISAHDSAG